MIIKELSQFVGLNNEIVRELFSLYRQSGKMLFLRSDLWDAFKKFAEEKNRALLSSPLAKVISKTQEGTFSYPWFYLDVRPRVANWYYIRFNLDSLEVEELSVAEFLHFKESVVCCDSGEWPLEIDLAPFEREFPKMTQTRSIGRGVEYLNRRLSSRA